METVLLEYLKEFGLLAILVSFLVGIISALNPCSVITYPFFIASSITLSDSSDIKKRTVFIYKYSLLFFMGMITSYSILLLSLSKLGKMLKFSPFFIYILTGILTLVLVAYSLKLFGSFDNSKIINKLIPYKFFGAFSLGFVHGFISSPCGSAPFIALLTLASQTDLFSSYILVLAFAMGQGMILLFSGVFIGVIQGIRKNHTIVKINNIINNIFIGVLIFIGFYFFYKAYLYF